MHTVRVLISERRAQSGEWIMSILQGSWGVNTKPFELEYRNEEYLSIARQQGLCIGSGHLNESYLSFREPIDNLSPEERDARTVFCMQLAARIRPRDLEDFFSAVGKVAFPPLVFVHVVCFLSILLHAQLRISFSPWIGS